MAGFERLPSIPYETLTNPERLGLFLELLYTAYEAGEADSITDLWQAALRSSIVVWNSGAYNAVIRVVKQLAAQMPAWKPLVWYYEGWHQFTVGNAEVAITAYENCIQAWEELGQTAYAAEAKLALGRIFQSQGDWARAFEIYSESVEPLLQAGQSHFRAAAFALHSLSDISLQRLKLKEAEAFCLQALDLLSLNSYESAGYGRAATLRNLGNVHRIRGDWSVALQYYQESLSYSRKKGNKSEEAHTLNCMGGTHLHRGDWARAKSKFHESLEIHTAVQDQTWIALDLGGLGQLAEMEGKYDEALLLLNRACELLENVGQIRHLANTFCKQASVYLKVGMYDMAGQLISKGRDMIKDLGDIRTEALLNEKEGWFHLKSGRLETAKICFLDGLVTFRQAGLGYKESDLLFALGALYKLLNRPTKAQRLFAKATYLARESDYYTNEELAVLPHDRSEQQDD